MSLDGFAFPPCGSATAMLAPPARTDRFDAGSRSPGPGTSRPGGGLSQREASAEAFQRRTAGPTRWMVLRKKVLRASCNRPPSKKTRQLMASRFMLCLALSAVLLNTVAEAAPPALVPLLDTIGERLAIADQVALSKWDSHKTGRRSPARTRGHCRCRRAGTSLQADGRHRGGVFRCADRSQQTGAIRSPVRLASAGQSPGFPAPGLGGEDPSTARSTAKPPAATTGQLQPYRSEPQCPQWLAQATHAASNEPLRQLALVRATAELCVFTKPEATTSIVGGTMSAGTP